jgi:hypothetical protein
MITKNYDLVVKAKERLEALVQSVLAFVRGTSAEQLIEQMLT